jgi:hypothetical protein
MWNKPEAHFAGDYFFQDKAFSGAAQVSEVFELGNTEGGIRIHGWIEGSATTTSGKTITVKVQVADTADAGEWTDIATNTVTATGTAFTGDIIAVIPDTDKKYMRVSVADTGSTTGNFTVAVEYVPR